MIHSPEKKTEELFSPERIRAVQEINPFAKITNIVYDILLDAILNAQIEHGGELNIAAIADSLGISRTPVFKAVEKLASNGLLVETERNEKYKKYAVFELQDDLITDLFNARKALETAAARICAQNIALLDLTKLKRLARDFQAMWIEYSADGGESFSFERERIDRQFHEEIIRLSGNKYFLDMYRSIQHAISYLSVRTCEFIMAAGDAQSLLVMGRQHVAICETIETGIPEMAAMALDTHISFCHQCCLIHLQSRGQDGGETGGRDK